MSIGMKNFFDNLIEPVSVSLTDKFSEALDKMLENDFSQLPVIDNQNQPIGFVTYQSITRSLLYLETPTEELFVSDIFEEINSTQIFLSEDELSAMLDRLRDANAILIVDAGKKLIGIVTTYDSTEYFRTRSEDLLDVQDIEAKIKEILLYVFQQQEFEPDTEDLQKAIEKVTKTNSVSKRDFSKALCDYLNAAGGDKLSQIEMETTYERHFIDKEDIKSFSDLSLYGYIALLLHEDQSPAFEQLLNYPPDRIRKLLDDVRNTRNDLAHLKEISPTQRDKIVQCKKLLERIQIRIPVDWPKSNQEVSVKIVSEDETNYEIDPEGLVRQALLGLGGEIISEETNPRESRYTPLADWLQSQPGSIDQVQLTFEQIEEVIDGNLPRSAYDHRAWWANDTTGHPHARLWLEAGWRSSYVNMTEKRLTFARVRERQQAYINFFSKLLTELREHSDLPFRDVAPGGSSYSGCYAIASGGSNVAQFGFSFIRSHGFRVELYIDKGNKEVNKQVFDRIYAQREEIEAKLEQVSWERIDQKQASRIAIYHPGSITDSEEELDTLRKWGIVTMIPFIETIEPVASRAFDEVLAG